MRIPTEITELLGIDLPIIGAPMFLVSYPDLVVAVSEAGGLGTFPSMNYRSPSELRDALSEIRSRTRRPIGVNILLYKDHNPDWAEQLKVCLDFKVDLIITSMGTPRSVVKEAKSVGSKVFCDVTNLRMANIVAKGGADALIAVCQGAGGHAGSLSPFSLIPYLKEQTGLPVIAAGSISTGRQMAAALSLGAGGVYVGTGLIATEESGASPQYKQMVIDSGPEEIVYTDSISGVPANWMQKSLDVMARAKEEEGGKMTKEAAFKRWRDIWSAGHGVAQIQKVKKAGDLIGEMVAGYTEAVRSLPNVEGSI